VPARALAGAGWAHLAYVTDPANSRQELYINGVSVESFIESDAISWSGAGTNTFIGRNGNGNGLNTDGKVDEARIYNRALSPAEVAALAKSGLVKFTTSSVNLQQGSTLASGLVGHWTFDGQDTNWTSPTTGTTADRSGNNNTGTLTGMNQKLSPTIGHLGQALNFDGSNDFVVVTPMAPPTLAVSYAVWAKIDPSSTSGTIVKQRGGWGQQLGMNSSAVRFTIHTDVNVTDVDSVGAGLNDNQWHHIVGTYDGSTMNLYVDGVLNNSGSRSGATLLNDDDTTVVGAANVFGSGPVKAVIDDVRIYNRALSPTEIQQLYKLGTVRITQ
jgi:hypothetical protein